MWKDNIRMHLREKDCQEGWRMKLAHNPVKGGGLSISDVELCGFAAKELIKMFLMC
jgi:hypothetical protein